MVEFMGPMRRGLAKVERGLTSFGESASRFSKKIEPYMPGPLLVDRRIMQNAEKFNEYKELYQDIAGFGPDADFSSKAFSELMEKRAQDFTAFTRLKDALAHPNDAMANDANIVKKKLADALNPEVKLGSARKDLRFANAKNKFEAGIEAFQELKNKVPSQLPAQATVHTLRVAGQDAQKALTTQQKKELAHIEQLFNDPEFTDALKNTHNLHENDASLSPGEKDARENASLNTIKESMLSELKTSHKTQLEAFNKANQETEKNVHKAAFAVTDEASFIRNLEENGSREVKAKIKKAREESRAAHEAEMARNVIAGVRQNEDDESTVSVDGITLKALGNLKLNTGITLTRKDDGTYTAQMPGYFRGLFVYGSMSKKVESTLLQMAQLAKLSGKDEIVTVLNGFSNPDVAKQRAQQAYAAAIKAGFPPDKIIIKINGQVYRQSPNKEKGEKGFTGEKDSPFANWSNYGNLNAQSPNIIKRIEKSHEKIVTGPADAKKVASVKEKLMENRDYAAAVQAEADEKTEEEREAAALGGGGGAGGGGRI